MIKNVLIPEKLGNNYIFSKRVVGFDIDKTHITATQVYLSGKSITVERCLEEKLETGVELTHGEKVVKAIKNIISKLDSFDEIYSSISSSHIIFKSLKLPFTNYNKIKSVINYEVEPLLPFSVNNALIDFIVTKHIPVDPSAAKQTGGAEVMVAAAQRSVIDEHVKLFEDAGVMPSKVVVDLLSLYSLYKNIPAYANLTGSVVLVDVGFNITRLAYIHDGSLAFVRTLPKGIFSQAKKLSQLYKVSQNEAAEIIMRYGYQKEDDQKYKEAVKEVANHFWSDIKFTIQSFAAKLPGEVDISRLLILGQGAKLVGITSFAGNFLSVPCQLFQTTSLIDKPNVSIKDYGTIPAGNIMSLAVAFPSLITDKFNLYKVGEGIKDTAIINKQLITAFVFVFIIFGMLFMHSYMQVNIIRREAELSEQEAVSHLRSKFKKIEDEVLDEVIESAKSQVKKLEEWFAFASKDKFSYLKYLLALHDAIDKEGTGIKVESISISPADSSITLKAQVKSFDALKKLEKDLRKVKLFSAVSSPETTSFEMKINLAKNI